MYTPCVIAPSVGSPPHVRGKAIHGLALGVHAGITPACAGKSITAIIPRVAAVGSPPRMRGKCVVHVFVPEKFGITPAHAGEKQQSALGDFSGKGSPPHVRGKAHPLLAARVSVGITPACAGKSLCSCARCPFQRDHPRMCGEKLPLKVCKYKDYGSPPRMRGKVRG